MYVRSLATTRMGKYVRGNAAADSTIEYSVTLIGSTAVTPTTTATKIETSTTRWNRAASLGRTSLPHCHPKYCDTVYPHESAVSSAAPKVHATKPTMMNASPTLPRATE